MGLIFFNKFNAPQWVVAFFLISRPAFPNKSAPVHIDATISVFLFFSNQANIFLLSNSFLVPIPPGINKIFNWGQSFKVYLHCIIRSPEALIFFLSEKVNTLNGQGRFFIEAI